VRDSRDAWIAAGLFSVALLIRVLVLALCPFDGLYGQDAYAYYDYAVTLRASLMHGQPFPPFFWPLGYPLHVVAAMGVLGVTPLAGQMVSLIAGALIAPLTFALTREALLPIDARRARRAGVAAGLIVAAAGQLMISSVSIMSDATGLAWATASAWLTLHYASRRTLRPVPLMLAAFALSMAVIARWVYGLLAFPWAACVGWAWRRNWSTIGWRRATTLTLSAIVVGGVIVGAQLLAGEAHTGDLQVVGWHPANILRRQVVNSDGAFEYALPTGLFYARPLIDPSFAFPLLTPLLVIGARTLVRSGRSASVLLIGWLLVVYVFLAGIAWQNERFSLAFFPPLAVWVGLGTDAIWQARRTSWLVGLLTVSLTGMGVWGLRDVSGFVNRKNADVDRARHAASQLPDDARVITFGLTLTLKHYTDLDAIEIYGETPDSLRDRVCGHGTVFAYLDVVNIERQWQGLSPEINYHALRDGPGLTMIDLYAGFTLLKIGDCE